MDNISEIAASVREAFDHQTEIRDKMLIQARSLTRHAAHAIRAIHRNEYDLANEHLKDASTLVSNLKNALTEYPQLFYAGYTQDALKEFAEANITLALIQNQPLPTPEVLGLENATYLNGLAETTGELRRRCLDILRKGYSDEAERLLGCMDEIYSLLVTIDYADAITNGLRRQTDLVRGILERTRGDLTLSLREQELQQTIKSYIDRLLQTTGSN